MAKITVYCRKCGKEMRLNFEDTRSICKKCRRSSSEKFIRTTKNFDF